MDRILIGILIALAVMNPSLAKNILTKGVDGLHAVYVQVAHLAR